MKSPMPTKRSDSITLSLGKSQIPLKRFKEAVAAFFDLLESVSKEAAEGEPIRWKISVQRGSALVIARPEPGQPKSARVFTAIPNGMRQLESGKLKEAPDYFSEKAIRAARRLSLVRDRGDDAIPVQLLVGNVPTEITSQTAAAADDLVESAYQSYGSIEGKLLMLSDEQGFKFAVFQPLFNKRIICFVDDDLVQRAIEYFRRRVIVRGKIQYNRLGNPVSVKVHEIFALPSNSELPSVAEMKGILA